MQEIINDLGHLFIGGTVVVLVGFGLASGPVLTLLLGAIAGALIGLLAEAKEANPHVFRADPTLFSLRDIAGYAVGAGFSTLAMSLIVS